MQTATENTVKTPPETSDLLHIAESLRGLVVPIEIVTADPANARLHSPRNLEAIKGSLRKFGQVKPIVCSRAGICLAGNGTLQSARELGWRHIAVVYVDFSDVSAAAFAIADNRTAELATWDQTALVELMQPIQADESFDITSTGFSAEEVAAMINSQNASLAAADGKALDDAALAAEVKKCPHCGGVL